jgi:hypothetical protein
MSVFRHSIRTGAVRAGLVFGLSLLVAPAEARPPAPQPADCGYVAGRAAICPPGATRAQCRQRRRLTRQRCRTLTRGIAPPLHIVTVDTDGNFSPRALTINSGDMVLWEFDIATHYTDSIIPIEVTPARPERPGPGSIEPPVNIPAGLPVCPAKPFDPDDPNEFTGPLPRAPSGIFILNPDEEPYTINPDLWAEDFTGIFIRLRWNDVNPAPGQFDWSVLDDQMEKAVRHGKMFSLVFKAGKDGIPDWIFEEPITIPEISAELPGLPAGLPGRSGGARELLVRQLFLRDTGADPAPGSCGSRMRLGSPADLAYRIRYFQLLRAAAAHIKSRNIWYRSLAHIKLSGANLHSAENRLPKRCWSPTGSGQTADECDCVARGAGDPLQLDSCICNPQVWATEGGYTPGGLYEFYRQQADLLAEEFPDKDMSFMLIQDGWPEVNDDGEYVDQDLVNAQGEYVGGLPPAQNAVPSSVNQLNALLDQGAANHGARFLVQHNGLRPEPQYEGEAPCTQSGRHPTYGPFDTRGPCPNRHALLAGERNGSITGFQTVNKFFEPSGGPLADTEVRPPLSVRTVAQSDHQRLLDSMGWTFWNAYYNTDAVFIEIYEYMLAELLGEEPGGMTFREWAEVFHNRRRQAQFTNVVADPFPLIHGHIFQHTGEAGEDQVLKYTHGLRCHEPNRPAGTITIRAN